MMKKMIHPDAEAMTGLSLVVKELSEQLPAARYQSRYCALANVVCSANDLGALSSKSAHMDEGKS